MSASGFFGIEWYCAAEPHAAQTQVVITGHDERSFEAAGWTKSRHGDYDDDQFDHTGPHQKWIRRRVFVDAHDDQ